MSDSTSGKRTKNTKRQVSILLSLLCMIFFRFLPAPSGMTASAMQVIGIFLGSLILWMTISIDWPSLLCILALAFVPEIKMGALLENSFGNATFAFLIFTFMCTYSLSQTSFIRRCAVGFVHNPFAQKGPWHFVILYFASVLFLGSFMSPTVLVIVYIAITEEIYHVLGLQKGGKVGNMMMMGMVFCSGIAAGMTPIAHIFPLISFGIYESAVGRSIGYAQYMLACVPVGIVTAALMILLFKLVLKPDMAEIKSLDVAELKAKLEPASRREKSCIAIFFLVVALWVLPGLLRPVFPEFYTFVNSMGTAMPPLLGAVAMAIVTGGEEKPLLNFGEATTKGVPWASVMMTAGTLALGFAMTHKEIGLTDWISAGIAPVAATLAPLAIVALFVFWSAVQTNFSSSMVTATVVTTIAMPICLAAGAAVNPAATATLVGMMSAFAFATPPAMPTVVFAIGTGWTTPADMAKYGFTLMFISVAVAILLGYPIASALMV